MQRQYTLRLPGSWPVAIVQLDVSIFTSLNASDVLNCKAPATRKWCHQQRKRSRRRRQHAPECAPLADDSTSPRK